MVKEFEGNPEFQKSVKKIEDFLGLKDLGLSPRKLQKTVDQTQSLVSRAKYLFKSIGEESNGWRLLFNLVGIIIIIPSAVFLLAHQIGELIVFGKNFPSIIASIATGGAWLRPHLTKIASFLDSMTEAKNGLDHILEEAKKSQAVDLAHAESMLKEEEEGMKKAEHRLAEPRMRKPGPGMQ